MIAPLKTNTAARTAQYLLRTCTKNKRAAKRDGCLENSDGSWSLSLSQRRDILLNNLYGVDLDAQAVEVAQMSLYLKMLEDATTATARDLFSQGGPILPSLKDNIICGNSLIDWDIFAEGEQERRLNPMSWQDAFPAVMKSGGFDAIVGNPLYGAALTKLETNYVATRFPSARKFPDSYCLFMLQGIKLLKHGGLLSYIVPNTFCDLENCDEFRRYLLVEHCIENIWQSGWAFKQAVVDTVVFTMVNAKPEPKSVINIAIEEQSHNRAVDDFLGNQLLKIDYRNTREDKQLLCNILSRAVPLEVLLTVNAGVKMYEKGKGNPPQSEATLKEKPFSMRDNLPDGWRPLFRGEDVTRFQLAKPKEFVNYGPWLAAPRDEALFIGPKILMRRTDDRLMSCLEKDSAICVNSCHIIKYKKEATQADYDYLLGLLNSRLMQRVFEIQNPQMIGKTFAEIKVIYVRRLPIRIIDLNDKNDAARHEKMVGLVTQMLEARPQLATARTDRDRALYERKVASLDRQIDTLVYELYGLTDEEIAIVDGSDSPAPI